MSDRDIRPHAAHRGKSSESTLAEIPVETLPSYLLDPESDEVRLLLEELDDVVFSAVRGDASALEQAQTLWPEIIATIGWELVEESREQYLRFAIDITQRVIRDETRKPEHAIAALEVISLLTQD